MDIFRFSASTKGSFCVLWRVRLEIVSFEQENSQVAGTAEQGWRPASLWRVRCRSTERYEPKCVSANSVRSGMRLRADVFPVATSWSYLMRKLSL